MRTQILMLSLSAALTATGCQQTECAPGTIERDGKCEPSEPGLMAICGDGTVLVAGQCLPALPPTECDPNTTMATIDPDTGITICQGTGGSCAVPIACPKPTGTKQTICGQLYDFKDGSKFQQSADPKGIPCDPQAPTTTGPCALQILPYDAIDFADGVGGTPGPLANNGVVIDDCGRYRVSEIETSGTGPFIALGIDDANMPLGPAGSTVTVAVATPKIGATATQGLEGFIVAASTATGWAGGGANFGTTGIFAPVFRQHKVGNGDQFAYQTGVTVTKAGNTVPANDFYFAAAATDRTTLDGAATSTGANGTVLVNSASVADSAVWGGNGGLGIGCRWEPHAGATLPGIILIQVFRKLDIVGMTCAD